MTELSISSRAARRFLVHSFALPGFQTLPDVSTALDALEFVQMDSINVCGRIHDLILWPRVAGYAPTLLQELLYGAPRRAFEYPFPNLCVLPLRDHPYFARAMQARAQTPGRWHGLLPEEEAVAEWLLARMDESGPLRTRAAGREHGHTTSGWGTRTTVAARVIEKLWLHGRLSVARRENFERWFDRTERLLPSVAKLPSEQEEQAYKTRKRLRARRLFRLAKNDGIVLGGDAFVRVIVDNDKRAWFALAEDAPALLAAEHLPVSSDNVLLLAPLDPLVYDRARTRALFGFDYTWEVYTPQIKRRWGYYVLPILHGDRLIGRVDPKLERKTGTLNLHSLRLENSVDADEIALPLAARLIAFAQFLGANRIALGALIEPESLRAPLSKNLL